MPKTRISEYSTTNSDNTDIESINIAEGCAPSGINNAIRELMVHLKEFQTGASGDAFTFAGGVLISGTANTITGNVLMSGTNTITGSTTATFAAGAVGTPSIAAHGDTNTGIFFPAADTIAFAEGGAEAMRLDSSGRVLIGTTTAQGNFTVNPNTAENVSGFFGSSNTAQTDVIIGQTGYNSIRVQNKLGNLTFATGAAATERMRIDSSGNVGIGTSSPAEKFEVYGTNPAISIYSDSTSGRSDLFFKDSGGASGRLRYDHTSNYLAIFTNGAEAMRIDSSGNVGIGTSSPSGALGIVRSGNAYVEIAGNNNTPGSTSALFGQDNVGVAYAWNRANFALLLGTNNTERARITSGGYFKASNNGSYVSSTGPYHEFNNNDNNECLVSNATNASYSSDVISVSATRSANSAYDLLAAFSGNFGDLEFRLRGDGNGYADGTWNNNGADYAEFFESVNGQALTLGATVVLDGTKVREATAQDPASAIIGVVRPKEPSKASMVVGNTAWNKWANKYLTDDFDRYIMEDHDVVEWEEQVLEREAVAAVEAVVDEDGNEVSPAIPAQEAVYKTKQHSYESHNIPAGVTVPADAVRKTHDDKGNKFQHYKLNPAWDKDAEYVNRENRPEWNIIGLLGQVKILKGQPVGDRWIKMRDVSATVEEWMIR